MEQFHVETAARTLAILKSGERGLTTAEAEARRAKEGDNVLREAKKKNLLFLFLSQFKDFMLMLLIAAAVMSAVVAYMTKDSKELIDTFIIAAIILLNAVIGFVQQLRADKAIEQLKKLSVSSARVVRDGKETEIKGTMLVPGDVIDLEEGDVVPADCRILRANRLVCDESALTGESHGVYKSETALAKQELPIGDRKNMLFSSTFVIKGNARAIVTATGMKTEVGQIASGISEAKPQPTPLEKGLGILGRVVSVAVILISLAVFLIGVFVRGTAWIDNFMTAVAIAVAAIPEGLTAVVTIIMAMGVQRMSKKKVIIRKLHAVETLGGCNCICTDKTGTLTENKMRVEETWTLDGARQSLAHSRMLACMAHCNTVKGERGKYLGDPTEIALKVYLDATGYRAEPVKLIDALPFDSERKRMSVAVRASDGTRVYVKGGADVIAARCDFVAHNGITRPMTASDRAAIARANSAMATRALRVLGFAYAESGTLTEERLIFAGLCGMIDPPRQGVKEAVSQCAGAGIRTVMITGDHSDTAYAIGVRLGIADDRSQLVSGEELDRLRGDAQKRTILGGRIFARVSPKHKLLVVKTLQEAGFVVSMTGDGINDAPSIKSADIGIAMGISGTEVTKSASDMVIADDNFSTIVSGVKEGRRIFDNIKKTIQFFLATNLSEVLSILAVTFFFSKNFFLLSTQLLWINLITDSFPVLALGVEPAEKNIMSRPPERAAQSLFAKRSVLSIVTYGFLQSAIVVGVFAYGLLNFDNATASTMAFFTISFLELFHTFNVRSESGTMFQRSFFRNPILHATVALGIGANLLLTCIPPLSAAFGLVALSMGAWGVIVGAALAIIPLAEIYKFVLRGLLRRKKRLQKPNASSVNAVFGAHARDRQSKASK